MASLLIHDNIRVSKNNNFSKRLPQQHATRSFVPAFSSSLFVTFLRKNNFKFRSFVASMAVFERSRLVDRKVITVSSEMRQTEAVVANKGIHNSVKYVEKKGK